MQVLDRADSDFPQRLIQPYHGKMYEQSCSMPRTHGDDSLRYIERLAACHPLSSSLRGILKGATGRAAGALSEGNGLGRHPEVNVQSSVGAMSWVLHSVHTFLRGNTPLLVLAWWSSLGTIRNFRDGTIIRCYSWLGTHLAYTAGNRYYQAAHRLISSLISCSGSRRVWHQQTTRYNLDASAI